MLFFSLVAQVYLARTQPKLYGSQQSSVVAAVACSSARCCSSCSRASSAAGTMRSPATSGAPAFFVSRGEAAYCFTVRNTCPRFAVSKELLRQLLLAGVFLLTVGHLAPDHTGCPDRFHSCVHHSTTRDNNCISSTARPSRSQSCFAWIRAPVSGSGHFHLPLFAFVRAAASTYGDSLQATPCIVVPTSHSSQVTSALIDSLVTTDAGEPGSSDYAGTVEDLAPRLTRERRPTGLDGPRSATGQEAPFDPAVPQGEGRQLQLNPDILTEQQQDSSFLIVKQLMHRHTDSRPPVQWTAGTRRFPHAEPDQQGATTTRSADGGLALNHENHPPQQQLQQLKPTSQPVLVENEDGPNLQDHRVSQGHGEPRPSAGAGDPRSKGDSGSYLYSEGDQWRSRTKAGLESYDRRREATDTIHQCSKLTGRGTARRIYERHMWMHEAAAARRHSRSFTHVERDEPLPHKQYFKWFKEKTASSSGGKETRGAEGHNTSVSREAEVFSDTAINGEDDGVEDEKKAREVLAEKTIRRLTKRMEIPPTYQPATPTYASPYEPLSPLLPLHPRYPTTLATYTMPAATYRLLKLSQSQDMVSAAGDATAAPLAVISQGIKPQELPSTVTQERAKIQLPEETADSFMQRQAKESPGEGRAVHARRRRELAFYGASRGGKKYFASKIHQGVTYNWEAAFVDALVNVATAVMFLGAAEAIIYSSRTGRALRRECKEYGSNTKAERELSLPDSGQTPAPPRTQKGTETGSPITTDVIDLLQAAMSVVVGTFLRLHTYVGGAVSVGKAGYIKPRP